MRHSVWTIAATLLAALQSATAGPIGYPPPLGPYGDTTEPLPTPATVTAGPETPMAADSAASTDVGQPRPPTAIPDAGVPPPAVAPLRFRPWRDTGPAPASAYSGGPEGYPAAPSHGPSTGYPPAPAEWPGGYDPRYPPYPPEETAPPVPAYALPVSPAYPGATYPRPPRNPFMEGARDTPPPRYDRPYIPGWIQPLESGWGGARPWRPAQ